MVWMVLIQRYYYMCILQKKRHLYQISALVLLLLLLAACSGSNTGNSSTPAATTKPGQSQTPGEADTPTQVPGIRFGAQPCPLAVNTPEHWDPIIPTQAGTSKVESVICGYLKGVVRLQALVTVRYDGTGGNLDVYVYDNLTSSPPDQMFKLQGLSHGQTKISGYNSVLTVEVDENSHVNKGKAAASQIADLAREFKWSDGAGTLVPVAFSGIFPDLTRYQAEADQKDVNQGKDIWKLNPTRTAQEFGATLLHWDANAQATVVSGGGQHDAEAEVTLKNTAAGSKPVTLSMARLEGNTNGGIWIITAVSATGMEITAPQGLSTIQSPVTVTGKGDAFEAVIGTVTVLDHLYTDVGHATARGAQGNGNTTFSTGVTFNSTFQTGAEDGLVMLSAENNASGGTSAVVIIKVLLQ